MRPAANHGDLLRKIMIPGIAVCMEVSMEAIQKFLWMFSTPPRLVFVQHNGLLRIPAGAVKPHIVVALRCFSRLMEDLERRFIRMEYFSDKQFPVQSVIYRL